MKRISVSIRAKRRLARRRSMASSSCAAWFSIATCSSQSWRRMVTISAILAAAGSWRTTWVGMVATYSAISRASIRSFLARAPRARANCRSLLGLMRRTDRPAASRRKAARQATRTIPIVFATHADPVGVGHVASLPRPGGNATGLSVLQTELTAKALEVLKVAVPHAARFGVLFSSDAASSGPTLQAAESAAERLKVTLVPIAVRAVEDFEKALARVARDRA